jgi:hypothetical protein
MKSLLSGAEQQKLVESCLGLLDLETLWASLNGKVGVFLRRFR